MKRIDLPRAPLLEMRELRVILALARAGSTARAAEALHLTQPAVSRALLGAESKLGVRLFERTPRGLSVTAAAERLLPDATRLLLELADLERRVCAPAVEPRELRLVAECYTAYHWLPSALVGLRQSLPELELTLSVEHTSQPIAALLAEELDVALVTTSRVEKKHARLLEERTLFRDEVVFVVSSAHPLARRPHLTPRDLAAYPLLTSRTPPGEAEWFLRSVFGPARPKLTFERIPLTEAVLDVARAGLGIAVLSEWIVSPHLVRGGLVLKRLAQGALERPWSFIYRRAVKSEALRLLPALLASAPRNPDTINL